MRPTTAEIGAWIAFGVGAIIYVITLIVISNAGYGFDAALANAWLTFGGAIAGLGFVPGIILTGVRQLGAFEPARREREPGREDHAER